jgi:Fe(3+) dicitrate transport protein
MQVVGICSLLLLLSSGVWAGVMEGVVVDGAGAGVANALVQLECPREAPKYVRSANSLVNGTFRLAFDDERAKAGCRIVVTASGFARMERNADAGMSEKVELVLAPATLSQEIIVSAASIAGTPEHLATIPGSVTVLDTATLQQARLFTAEEALRKAPGVYARPEEGFGLRPNISIRGLNPTRSSRVLLLEDGVPLAYAPYGDNASYYHPPMDRFDFVEVVKGSGQIQYGPMTVGGVVNYVTPAIPDRRAGSLLLAGGNRDYGNAHLRWGGTFRGTGVLLDGVRKQGEGARDNTRSGLNDFTAKVLRSLGGVHALSMKANVYTEDSRVTYTGLRQDEWLANPRQNPFRNDGFTGRRFGASVTHNLVITPNAFLTTTGYGMVFSRDWWRQSSNSNQRPNTNCGGLVNLNTTCGNEGRLRDYHTWGVESRLQYRGLQAGVRAHYEDQERLQVNGQSPLARTGTTVENNERRNQAYSGFMQYRLSAGKFALTPGIRLEHVRFRRTNRLFNNNAGVFGETTLTQAIPGVGVSYQASKAVTVFAGVHRGFAPPRTEDIISNSGGFVELDPELSWNYEAGVRARATRALTFESTWFRMNYENQIIPASLAGGVGAVLTSAGRTRHEGMEMAGRYEVRGVFVRGAWTWLPRAKFVGTRFSNVSGFAQTRVTGNRLPYAPETLLNGQLGYQHRTGVNFFVEGVQTGRHYSDDLNSINPTADGQRGAIPGNVIWNGTLNVPFEAKRTTLFLTVKNLFDRTVIVDRARGILPNSPRLVQAGFRFDF